MGLVGAELEYFHPMNPRGFWAQVAETQGILSPYAMKQKRLREEQMSRARQEQMLRACLVRRGPSAYCR